MAFRSVPRPSSPPGAKASTERPSLALSYAKSEARASDLPSCTGTIQPSFAGMQDLSPSTCRLIPGSCENNHLTETDAPSSTSILFTPLNTSGCGDLVFAHLLRSDLQPARPDAPNPDSHVKRTKPAFLRRPATSARPSPGYLTRGSAQCSHDLLSHRDGVSPTRAKLLMEVDGIEPTTPCLQSRCSPTELHPQETHSE